MAKSTTSFPKGKSGNPGGRPPNNRALTKILESVGDSKVDYDGKKAELDVTSGGEKIIPILKTGMDLDEI